MDYPIIVRPPKYALLSVIATILFMNIFAIIVMNAHLDLFFITGVLVFDCFFLFVFLKEKKTFSLYESELTVESTYLHFLFKDHSFLLDEIERIIIVKYPNYTTDAILTVNTTMLSKKFLFHFRESQAEKEFQSLINSMRDRGILVKVSGTLWY